MYIARCERVSEFNGVRCVMTCIRAFVLLIFFSVYALDAKMKFDDNAEFRQKEIFAERDWSQEDAKEVEASRYNLNYIALDGE